MIERTIRDIADVERYDDAAIVTLRDRMDAFSAPLLTEALDRLLDAGVVRFIIDLSSVRVVDADGDYPLLHLLKCTQTSDCTVTLVCPEGNPIRIFYEMMHLDTLFTMAPSLDYALATSEFAVEV
ncbi:MAG: STAS domain-containing protein [Anaerolineae bacterium]|jgi:anti-anti-sigma factor|nr:STAS domain-containing protein [Anaerolineae bacterium]